MVDSLRTHSLMPFRDGSTWVEVTRGQSDSRAPVVALHGGPGMAHDYLEPLHGLADDGWPVVLYDQFGCGRSTHRPDAPADSWTVDLFLEELDAVLDHVGVSSDYHLFGHSWGGMLAAEHAVRRPAGLRSLILSNSLASSELWARGAARLRAGLPDEVEEVLDRHEAAGTVSDAEYVAATDVYYARHFCRVPHSDFLQASFAQQAADSTVYQAMWGPNEFAAVGSLKDWSVVDRLGEINVATLVISGEFDEATSECRQPFLDSIADVREVVVANASHVAMIEEPDAYFSALRAFLSDADG